MRGSKNGQRKSLLDVDRFVAVDLNGWLDHMVVGSEDGQAIEASTLGIRSCLFPRRFRRPDPDPDQVIWLLGAQALASARDARAEEPLLDAIDALAFAAGYGNCPDEDERRHALADALWQLVADLSKRSDNTTHLAVVVADGRYLGSPKIELKTGQTRLETLYNRILQRRPRELNRSRLELIWRSVATLHAARKKAREQFGNGPASVPVISVNRRVFWTELKLRHWSPNGEIGGALHIARSAVMEECALGDAWMTQRIRDVESDLPKAAKENLDLLKKWTRLVEMLATGMNPKSLAKFGVNVEGLEHRSWPAANGEWGHLRKKPTPTGGWPSARLSEQLNERRDDALRVVFDDLIGAWECGGATRQDKYLLAAVTHPLARRVSVRKILGEDKQRFDRVARFLRQQLNNLLKKVHDHRPNRPQPSLELRYITMGYRGLCQIRYSHPDWFPYKEEDARLAHNDLREAKKLGRPFEQDLVERTAPYLIGEGKDPTMPGGF